MAFSACASPPPGDASDQSNLTSIPNTAVQDQKETGNCWLYMTAAWAESLHAAATSDTKLQFSPAYWNYWDWYEYILIMDTINAGVAAKDKRTKIDWGGTWEVAVKLANRYGMMPINSFVADDGADAAAALERINASLTTGSLSTPGARADKVLVRQALDDAFKLSSDLRSLLTSTFGKDGQRTFDTGATASGLLIRTQDLKVRTPRPDQDPLDTTLDKLITGQRAWKQAYAPGQPDARRGTVSTKAGALVDDEFAKASATPGFDYEIQRGDTLSTIAQNFGTTVEAIQTANNISDPNRIVAGRHLLIPKGSGGSETAEPGSPEPSSPPSGEPGNEVTYPRDPLPHPMNDPWRAFLRRVQRALNDGAPLPISWLSDLVAVDEQGHFTRGFATKTSFIGWHATLLTDYEVTHVPGFGTLRAGVDATEEQKKAALDDASIVIFLRVKNSWGKAGPTGKWAEPLAGFNDLDIDYLTQSLSVCPENQPKDTPCPITSPLIFDVKLPAGY